MIPINGYQNSIVFVEEDDMKNTKIRKMLTGVVLTFSLVTGGNSYAGVIVDAPLSDTILGAIQGINAAMQEAQQQFNQWLSEQAWFTQSKQMIESIKSINDAKNKLTEEITGITSKVTDYKSWLASATSANPQTKVNYGYAQLLPDELITAANCPDDSDCSITGVGYTSPSANLKSKDLRDSTKAGLDSVGSILGVGKNIAQITREAAEVNAQEIAVIDTMAREAFLQASNRVKAIENLQDGLLNPPSGDANDLKYTTDIQAMIVAEQALLVNDQNRIAALAVLQQSQRDRYDQRKKEIVNYVTHGSKDDSIFGLPTSTQAAGRVAIAAGTKGAFALLAKSYTP
jgi:uncharacterized protein with FMN-binding domain